MEIKEFPAFIAFGVFGAIVGLIAALLFWRRPHAYLWTGFGAAAMATVSGIWIVFALGVLEHTGETGATLGDSLRAGMGTAFVLMFALPFVSGAPAALFGIGFLYLIRRQTRYRKPLPPPLIQRAQK